jgi:hypothetical protein
MVHHLSVPIDLMAHSVKNKKQNMLKLLLALKWFYSGKFSLDQDFYALLFQIPGFTCRKTINKHLNSLIKEGWITKSNRSNIYFTLSFERIRQKLGLKARRACKFYKNDFKSFPAFIAGALITDNSQSQVNAIRKKQRRHSALLNGDRASKNNVSVPSNVVTLSIHKIAQILNCSPTRACQLKAQAERLGYIEGINRFQLYTVLSEADVKFKGFMKQISPNLACRLKCKRVPGSSQIEVSIQMSDEIKTFMRLTRRRRIH